MANEFVGPEEALEGLANATWGSVAVVLKNGEPQRLVRPGSRFGRGWRASFLGNLTFAQISTDSQPFGISVKDIPTSDSYHVGAELDVRVRLNPVSDYRHLEGFILTAGRAFAEDLIQEVRRGLETLVFETFGRYSHHDLRKTPMPVVFNYPLPMTLGSGLLQVTSLSVLRVDWDARALEVENAWKDRVANEARARADAQLGEEKLAIYAPVAAQLGLPPEALAYPEQHRLSQQRAHEALLALLKPEMRMVWQRNPELLHNLFQHAGISAPPSQYGAPPREVSGGHQAVLTAAADDTEIIVDPGEAIELNRDVKLVRAWNANETQGVLGIGMAREGESAVVLAVTSQGARPQPATLESLRQVTGKADTETIVLRAGPWQDLVSDWFSRSAPDPTGLRVDVAEENGGLVIRVCGPAVRADEAVKHLNSPGSLRLSALEQLVPFLFVDVALGTE